MEEKPLLPLSNNESKALLSTQMKILYKDDFANFDQKIEAATATLEAITKIILVNPIDWKNKVNGVNIEKLHRAAKSFTLAQNVTSSDLKRIGQRKGQNTETVGIEKLCHANDIDWSSTRVLQKCYSSRFCYICKKKLSTGHPFYASMCPDCGNFNFYKRTQFSSLYGQVALVTGGRIKIGFQVVLKLLRSGAFVIVTTRFPQDAAKRFGAEYDFVDWQNRLHVYALDMRFLSHVEKFCSHILKTYHRLDILIQNAAQTIRRPVPYYRNLYENECNSTDQFSLVHNWEYSNTLALTAPSLFDVTKVECASQSVTKLENLVQKEELCELPSSVKASQMILLDEDQISNAHEWFPVGEFGRDGQPLDLRSMNSWLLESDKVSTGELVEVSLINALSPFIILTKLSPLLKKTVTSGINGSKMSYVHVIMVSAMEGKFNRFKTSHHPHTNCAKAYLNMLVRTSASYYSKFCILLNAVDTGWVTDEVPLPLQKDRDYEFIPPLDDVDGAARILDPIFNVMNHGFIEYGKFYKDYKYSNW